MKRGTRVCQPDYRALAELRYQIRRFIRFSEQAARAAGLEPQQHQLLLAAKGLPSKKKPTIGVLAERLQLAHHSTVELVDRLQEHGLIERIRDQADRRVVQVRITRKGEEILRNLSLHHLDELDSVGPELVGVLNRLLIGTGGGNPKSRERRMNLSRRRKTGQDPRNTVSFKQPLKKVHSGSVICKS